MPLFAPSLDVVTAALLAPASGLATHATPAPDLDPDFEPVLDRRGTGSMKWDGGAALLDAEALAADPLPMWLADMDLRAPAVVRAALHEAVERGVFGYPAGPTPAYLDAVTGWQARRHGWEVAPEWVVPVTGIVTALKSVVQAFSSPGDSVLIQPPVYGHFHDDVRLNGRHPVAAPLVRTEDGYRFDAAVFEAALRPDTRIFILSNPHNPTGTVWSADDLRSMGEICARHDVLVVSDEIHQDLVLDPAVRHVPFASLGPDLAARSITCTSPGKTFNLPGLQCANLVVPDRGLRERFARHHERNTFPVPNVLGMVAAQAAYAGGEEWLERLLVHLRRNHALWADGVHAATDRVRVLPAASLYLSWTDFRGLGMDAEQLRRWTLTEARLWLDQGTKFGAEGAGHMRVNLGCPRATVEEALRRLTGALARL